jgi:hypothetical protein
MTGYNLEDLKELNGEALLELLSDFTRWSHYEATNEFDYMKAHKVNIDDVKAEILSRIC